MHKTRKRFFGVLAVVTVLVSWPFLDGCSSGTGNNTQPTPPTPSPPPPTPASVSIGVPAAGATVNKLPVTIGLNLLNGATLAALKVTVNGVDVTSRFTAGPFGTVSAQIDQKIYYGSNAVRVAIGSQAVRSKFNYDPGATATSTGLLGAPAPLTDVVPIQTRMQMYNGQGQMVWGVQVGSQSYLSSYPGGISPGGFQVVVLSRGDLSVVSNNTYLINSDSDVTTFLAAAGGNSCGLGGCMEIIQSLDNIGYDPCQVISQVCSSYGSFFASLGGTSTLGMVTQDSADLGYSLVTNVNGPSLHGGSSFERVTCASSNGCVTPSNPANSAQFLNGVAPNGADGVLTTLAGTGNSSMTNLPATPTMPAMTVSNNAAMAGVLLLDNNGKYTFNYANPAIRFQMGPDANSKDLLVLTAPAASSFTFPGGGKQAALESATLPQGAGGFHLAVYDAVTFQNLANSTYVIDPNICSAAPCSGTSGYAFYPLSQLATDILTFNSRKNILFLAGIGNLNHNFSVNNGQYNMQDVWDRVAQSVQDIGGTYATFDSLNNPAFAGDTYDQYTPNTVPQDDYVLVGQWWMNDSGVSNPYAMEESTQISRQTAKYPVPSSVDGVLEIEGDGYYRTSMHTKYAGLLPDIAFAAAAAPLQPPIPWPLTGSGDSSGVKAAYAWTSQQLLSCVTGCADIRAAYSNLNQSPTVWLSLLSNLDLPDDCDDPIDDPDCPVSFSEDDFQTAKAQLLSEFQYLGLVREYQNNVLGLLQAEQANVSIILQQTTDEVLGNVTYANNSSSSYGISNWRTDVEQALNIIGDASGFASLAGPIGSGVSSGVKTAIGLADFGFEASAKHTNDSNGRSLIEQEHDLVVASELAQKAADQYAQSLASIGGDFSRIVSDWGRLQAVAVPIANNQFPWDSTASSYLLKGFNLSIRRSFYQSLLASGYTALHYTYAAPGVHPNPVAGYTQLPSYSNCKFYTDMQIILANNPDAYAYFPGALIDGPGSPLQTSLNQKNLYPYDNWWDVWLLMEDTNVGGNAYCGTRDGGDNLPSKQFYDTTGLFRPIDPGNPGALGFYKPWLYSRSGIPVNHTVVGNSYNWWYDNSADGYPPFPYLNNKTQWYPDPDNY